MAYVIADPCIGTQDKSCVDVCPVDCIHFEDGVDKMLFIDPVTCIDCGACEPACPVNAIYPSEDDVPESQKDLIEANEVWYTDRKRAREIVETHIVEQDALMQILPDKRRDAHEK